MLTSKSGKRSAPLSCRDKGPGACPGWGMKTRASLTAPHESWCEQDRHEAPAHPRIDPLSLQEGGEWTFSGFPSFGWYNSSSAVGAILRFNKRRGVSKHPSKAVKSAVGPMKRPPPPPSPPWGHGFLFLPSVISP